MDKFTNVDFNFLGKLVHGKISAFKAVIGENPYPSWEESPQHLKDVCIGGARTALNADCTAKDIHDYWIDRMKAINPDHPSLVPFEELSVNEKIKDEIVVSTVKIYLKYLHE